MDNLSANAQQVLDALAEIGEGTTTQIREKTGKTARVTDKAVRDLVDAGLIVEIDLGDGGPARWRTAALAEATTDVSTDVESDAPGDTQPDKASDQLGAVTDAEPDETAVDVPNAADATDAAPADTQEQPVGEDGSDDGSGTPADDAATDTAPEPARPKPPADRRVLAVAGVLGDYPDGATIDQIAEACGFNVGVAARLLQAMEQADAARRIPHDTETGTPERWQPGPGKAVDVDPNPAPPRCPTCHQVIRNGTPKSATTTPRSGGTATVNADGNEPLGRGQLRGWVEQFINDHPGHELSPGAIADALGARYGRTISPGAVLNNCRTLAMNDQIQVVRREPFTVTANKLAESQQQ